MELTFADVLEIYNGHNQRHVENPAGKYPIYGSGGVMGFSDDFICPENTVVIGRKGNINKPIFVTTPFWNVDTAFGLVAKPGILLPKYLYYFCEWFDFEKLNTTVTIPSLTKANLLQIHIHLPSTEDQRKIVQIFEAVESLISHRQDEIHVLDQLIKARFVEMFGDNESNPKGWKQSRIGDCCTLKSGTSLPAEVENEGGPIPYVKVGDMNYPGNERYITTSSRYVSTTTAGNGLFAVGSILFPKRGGAIGTNKKRMTTLPICADLNIMGVSSNGALLPEYLLTYFEMIDLGALSDGSSVPQINNKNIAPLLIYLPPMELQREFAAFVSQVDKSKLPNDFSTTFMNGSGDRTTVYVGCTGTPQG